MSLRRRFLLFCLFSSELYPAQLSYYLPSTLTCPERFWPNSLCSIAPKKLKIICAEQDYFTNYASLSLIEKALENPQPFMTSFNSLSIKYSFSFFNSCHFCCIRVIMTIARKAKHNFVYFYLLVAYQLNDETKPHYITISKCPLFLSVLCV